MEELDFQGLLNVFKENHFERGERVILGHFGTVQLLLSLIFDTPVLVHMIGQHKEERVIVRQIILMSGDKEVCFATSRIQLAENSPSVVMAVEEGKLGLGQIVVTQQIPSRRILKKVERDEATFSRLYEIVGPGLYFEIHEQFPRQPFVDVGWLKQDKEA